MNTVFTSEDQKNALEFAYAMGLKAPVSEMEETATSLDFAYAMGLRKRQPAARKTVRRVVRHIPVPSI